MLKALARRAVSVEKLDSKTMVDSKSTLAERGKECIVELGGEKVR